MKGRARGGQRSSSSSIRCRRISIAVEGNDADMHDMTAYLAGLK
jgi:hypothetical protein